MERAPVPVTAKLSKKFYETLGDEIANELVEWFNQVDAAYHTGIREQFDTNFARFDAKLEQLRREMEAGFGQLRQEMDFLRSELRGEFKSGLSEMRAELLKWMFIYWVGSATTTVALILTVVSVLRS